MNKMIKNKYTWILLKVIESDRPLDILTAAGLISNDDEFFTYCEELRELVVDGKIKTGAKNEL